MLQQKFKQTNEQASDNELKSELQNRVNEWINESRNSKEELKPVRQKITDSIQAFCTTYLFDAVDKATFQLKKGDICKKMYAQLQQLIASLSTCESLPELTKVLEDFLAEITA